MMPLRPKTRTEMKGEQKRKTTTKQNTSNTWWKQLFHTFFPWALNRFKEWFDRFFLCSEMKIEFLLSTGIK